MKIAAAPLALCAVAGWLFATHAAAQDVDLYDGAKWVAECQAIKRPKLACLRSAFNDGHNLIVSLRDLARIQQRSGQAPAALDDAERHAAGLRALNRYFAPILRDEFASNPRAQATLPKLHAAIEIAAASQPSLSAVSAAAERRKAEREHDEIMRLFAEVDFSK